MNKISDDHVYKAISQGQVEGFVIELLKVIEKNNITEPIPMKNIYYGFLARSGHTEFSCPYDSRIQKTLRNSLKLYNASKIVKENVIKKPPECIKGSNRARTTEERIKVVLDAYYNKKMCKKDIAIELKMPSSYVSHIINRNWKGRYKYEHVYEDFFKENDYEEFYKENLNRLKDQNIKRHLEILRKKDPIKVKLPRINDKIPTEERIKIILDAYYNHHMVPSEIVDQLGVSRANVSKILHRKWTGRYKYEHVYEDFFKENIL